MPPRYVAQRRQISAVTDLPTGASQVSGVETVDSGDAASNTLIADPTALPGESLQYTAPTTFQITPTETATDSGSSQTSTSDGSTTAAGAKGTSISVGMVVGICIAVFIGLSIAVAIVLRLGSRKRLQKKYGLGNLESRNGKQDTERRRSGRELWVRMEEEKFSIKQSALKESRGGGEGGGETSSIVSRSITVKSGKSSKTFKSIGYGAGLGLAETFQTPEMPPHLEFTDPELRAGNSSFAHPFVPPPRLRDENVPVSWGSDTAVAENNSFLSLKHSSAQESSVISNDMASNSVPSFQTPPAVETRLHQWETAEVVSPNSISAPDNVLVNGDAILGSQTSNKCVEDTYDVDISRFSDDTIHQMSFPNPFQDKDPFHGPSSSNRNNAGITDSARSQSALSHASTAYYSAHAYPQRSDGGHTPTATHRLEVPNHPLAIKTTVSHDHAPSPNPNHAMAQLIAALNISPEEALTRLSVASKPTVRASTQSAFSSLSYYSNMTASEGGDTINEEKYRRFPLPPTDIDHHAR